MLKIKLLFLLLFFISKFNAQNIESQSYDLDFLTAKYIDSLKPKQVILIFKYQPKPEKEFKPVFSMKITYKIGDKKEKIEALEESNHSITFYDRKIKYKNPEIYKLIKDNMDTEQKEEYGIVVFYLNGITKKYIDKMDFKYGLWEPENLKMRIEKNYFITISK